MQCAQASTENDCQQRGRGRGRCRHGCACLPSLLCRECVCESECLCFFFFRLLAAVTAALHLVRINFLKH